MGSVGDENARKVNLWTIYGVKVIANFFAQSGEFM